MRTAFSLPARIAAPLLALTCSFFLSAFDAAAARLGLMTVRSAQGQPFDAEVALADWDETSERPRVVPVEPLRIRLAGRDELVWPTAWLDTSRVGNTVVRVRTEFDIPDPVFELTLRIESDRGQMVVTYPITLSPAGQNAGVASNRVRGVVALDDVPGRAVTVRPSVPAVSAQRSTREDPIADLLQNQQKGQSQAAVPARSAGVSGVSGASAVSGVSGASGASAVSGVSG
ncbi:MAG: FimV family protein, partial [Betaproteobacteria bacterium]